MGLIGGSFGLALKKAGFRGAVLGVSSEAAVRAGLERGAIDRFRLQTVVHAEICTFAAVAQLPIAAERSGCLGRAPPTKWAAPAVQPGER